MNIALCVRFIHDDEEEDDDEDDEDEDEDEDIVLLCIIVSCRAVLYCIVSTKRLAVDVINVIEVGWE